MKRPGDSPAISARAARDVAVSGDACRRYRRTRRTPGWLPGGGATTLPPSDSARATAPSGSARAEPSGERMARSRRESASPKRSTAPRPRAASRPSPASLSGSTNAMRARVPRASTACGASGAVMRAPARRGRPPARVVTARSASSPTTRCQQWCACKRVAPPGPQVTRTAGHGRNTPAADQPELGRGSSMPPVLRGAAPRAIETVARRRPARGRRPPTARELFRQARCR